VLSGTYQQAVCFRPDAARLDPKNRLLWRWPQPRLQAEAVRDSMLAVSGTLNPKRGGLSFYPTLPRAVLEGQSRPGDGWGKSDAELQHRRSIYIFVKRSLAVPELDLLDAPDTTSSCEVRPVSTTAPQALTFLNGAFANEMAGELAARLEREAGSDPAALIERAFELVLCRPPRADELQSCVAFLSKPNSKFGAQARTEVGRQPPPKADARRTEVKAMCLVLLNTNEFVYQP
jgi:hypothetical protein